MILSAATCAQVNQLSALHTQNETKLSCASGISAGGETYLLFLASNAQSSAALYSEVTQAALHKYFVTRNPIV